MIRISTWKLTSLKYIKLQNVENIYSFFSYEGSFSVPSLRLTEKWRKMLEMGLKVPHRAALAKVFLHIKFPKTVLQKVKCVCVCVLIHTHMCVYTDTYMNACVFNLFSLLETPIFNLPLCISLIFVKPRCSFPVPCNSKGFPSPHLVS